MSAIQSGDLPVVSGQYLCAPTVYAPASQSLLVAGSPTLTQLGLSTTVAAGSTGGVISSVATWANPSGGVLDVASTNGFTASGTAWVSASGPSVAVVTYTGTAATTLTGCAYVSGSAAGTVSTGGIVAVDSTVSQVSTGAFTAPPSGSVVVTATFVTEISAASTGAAFGLLAHGGSTVYGDLFTWRDSAALTSRPAHLAFYVTSGLTPGTTYTFDLGAAAVSGDWVGVTAIGQSTNTPTLTAAGYGGPVTMTVQAV